MRQIRTEKNGQQYEVQGIGKSDMFIFYCRTCALKMYASNKGFDYRCADCHEKAEGWCQMSSLIDSVIDHRNALIKKLDAAEMQGFFDGFYYDDDDECFKRLE